jgi:NADH-quinone oxidoreductase subunit I
MSSGTTAAAAQAKRVPRRNPLGRYFADIWAGIATTYLGMRVTITYFFREPVTLRYPEVRPAIPPGHRGLHALDESKCTLCHLCENNCPVHCITVEGLGRARETLVTRYDVDYSKCLFCNICAEVCPTQCVSLTERYNLAAGSREACQFHFARPKSDEEVAGFKALLAQREAERKARMAQKEAERKAKEQQEGPKPQ